ncbi:MAG: transcription elongation factor GreA [Acidobacteria bacterium]|nr:transcription elongation factor GreA [Acidobacteriota bacterium]MCB9398523.1 transcription elongation factor GreA [Acidobacteriota bacterium]
MTRKLLERLEAQAKGLEYELKSTLPEEIRKAASLGDLSENAEYESALERQRLLQTQLRSLKNRIAEIAVIDTERLPRDKVAYGAQVNLLDLDEDKEIVYRIVLPEDADIKLGRISMASPIGKSLLGHSVGDEIRVNVPSGFKNYEILEILAYADSAQEL